MSYFKSFGSSFAVSSFEGNPVYRSNIQYLDPITALAKVSYTDKTLYITNWQYFHLSRSNYFVLKYTFEPEMNKNVILLEGYKNFVLILEFTLFLESLGKDWPRHSLTGV